MLTLQFLKDCPIEEGLKELQGKYAISNTRWEDLIILNYCQIDSPKLDPIVRECRGLVINDRAELVAMSFRRFFNYGETEEEFDWNCRAYHKEDGSLITVYYYNGWKINTRASFGFGEINKSGHTWNSLVSSLLDFDRLHKDLTYVFELCSPFNQVVRYYDKPQLKLLSVNNRGYEYDHSKLEILADRAGIELVNSQLISSVDEAKAIIQEEVSTNHRFEGLVLKSNIRLKLKSEIYVRLHKMFSNLSDRGLLEIYFNGERAEAELYMPETKDKFIIIDNRLREIGEEMDDFYSKYEYFPVQKDFALAVKNHKYSSVLFQARKLGKRPSELKHLYSRFL